MESKHGKTRKDHDWVYAKFINKPRLWGQLLGKNDIGRTHNQSMHNGINF